MTSAAPVLATLAVAALIDLICLTDLARARAARLLPRWAWAAVILLATPFGAVLYVLAGRVPDRRRRGRLE